MNDTQRDTKFMIAKIGVASGEILSLIDKNNRPISLSEVEYFLNSDKELAYMSIGWLIRERYVHLIEQGEEKYLCSC